MVNFIFNIKTRSDFDSELEQDVTSQFDSQLQHQVARYSSRDAFAKTPKSYHYLRQVDARQVTMLINMRRLSS